MQDWIIFGSGLIASILIAESGTAFDVPGWVTTIGPWGVMYLIVERLTTNHSRALVEVKASLDKLAVILAKVEGIKIDQEQGK